MDILTCLLFACTLALSVPEGATLDQKLNEHIEEKLREFKVAFAKELNEELQPVQIKSYSVQWEKLWSQSLGTDRPLTVSMFDRMCILDKNRVMALAPPLSNETSKLRSVAFIGQERPIKFARSIEWKEHALLLVCHDAGSCVLYTGTNDLQLLQRQTLRAVRPVDASFFTRANRLYLIIVDNSDPYSVPSIIYYWTGTYMDSVDRLMAVGAVSVTTFKYKQSNIIVFAQSTSADPGIGSEVFEFKQAGVDRIQFLQTNDPVSVRHYTHGRFDFVLFVNNAGPSTVLWWDKKELLHWLELPDIKSSSLARIVHVDDDTFFFVARDNVVQVYKILGMSEWTRVDVREVNDGGSVIDMGIWTDGSIITVVLVTLDANNVYSVESWQLRIKETTHEDEAAEKDGPTKCFSDLIELLQDRIPAIEKALSYSKTLHSSTENLTITDPVAYASLILDSGTVRNINFTVPEEVLNPSEIEDRLDDLEREIEDVLRESMKMIRPNSKSVFPGDITVEGDAFFEELSIDSVDINLWNGKNVRSDEFLSSKDEQRFAYPLRGKNIIVENLEIASMCGIPSEHWALVNDSTRMVLDIQNGAVSLSNDTIHSHSDTMISNLTTKMLNNVDVDKLIGDLFIVGKNQIIKGNVTFVDSLQVSNLTLDSVNGAPAADLLTTTTDQRFEEFFIQELEVEHLYTESINGVPVEETARVSRENVIKGKVELAHLIVTEELVAETEGVLPQGRALQIYDNVTIVGNVTVKNLNLPSSSKLVLNEREVNLDGISETFWTKSTDQTIVNEVSFDSGVTVDRLDARYLNGFADDDYLYTTVREIPEAFANLRFDGVHFANTVFLEGDNRALYEDGTELTIHGSLRLGSLNASDLFTNAVNDVPMIDILNNQPASFTGASRFERIRAKRVEVDNGSLRFLNGEDATERLKRRHDVVDGSRIASATSSELHVRDIELETINGVNTKKLMVLRNVSESDPRHIVIDGDLVVENDLNIDRIGDKSPEVYLAELARMDIVVNAEKKLDSLVVRNLTTKYLNDHDTDSFLRGILSKSGEQLVSGQISFNKITSTDANVNLMNGRNTSDLIWTDGPLVLTGNVSFDDLLVKGRVATGRFNGGNISELYNDLLTVPSRNIASLTIDGKVSWEVPSGRTNSLAYLLENSVTRNTDQIVRGDTIFENDVHAAVVLGDFEGAEEIRETVSDTVIDDGKPIAISGSKVFQEGVIVDWLSVSNDLGIRAVNEVDFDEFNRSVVRGFREETVTGSVIFLDTVKADKLFVNDTLIHGAPLSGLAYSYETLPNNTVFENLVVRANVYLENLDGVNFDNFVNSRVTVSGNHTMRVPVIFNGLVEVTDNTIVNAVNGIRTSDFVLNGTNATQVIHGVKTFSQDLVVKGHVDAPIVNGIDVVAEFDNGILNSENAEIFGDLIVEAKLELQKNASVAGLVNDADLSEVIGDLNDRSNGMFESFRRNQTRLDEKIRAVSEAVQTLPSVFFYLEAERNITINAPNVNKVDVVNFGNVTKLNMFADQPGGFCGLPRHCPCPVQYAAELTPTRDCVVRKVPGNTVIWNIHEPTGLFGIDVASNATSSSAECSRNAGHTEFATISWLTLAKDSSGNVASRVEYSSERITGFLRDATAFAQKGEIYIVLAIYYDPQRATHRANSPIYKLNVETDQLTLLDKLPTDGAWDLEVFATGASATVHVLIGCYGESATSVLYQLHPVQSQLVLLRTFPTKSRYAGSLSRGEDSFVFLDDPRLDAVHVYRYDRRRENFYDYQTLVHDSPVNGIHSFYADYTDGDAFLIVTTVAGRFYVYEYMLFGKFQVKADYWLDEVQSMVPFHSNGKDYVFAGTKTNSTIFRIVKQGPRLY